MKHSAIILATIALALATLGSAHARQDDIDINRLTGSLNQLASDPSLGAYAQAEQARARDAINRLAQAGSRERPHALYLAERRVDLAKTAAQVQDAQVKLTQLDREHDQILLDNSRRDAELARRELERQRLQYQLAQEEAARLQAQGASSKRCPRRSRDSSASRLISLGASVSPTTIG